MTRESSQLLRVHVVRLKVKVLVSQLCPTLCHTTDYEPARLLCPWNSSGKNTGVGCHSLLQGILPTQRLNLDLLHCRQILYGLSHQGSPAMVDCSK